jgi:hypothetical protein
MSRQRRRSDRRAWVLFLAALGAGIAALSWNLSFTSDARAHQTVNGVWTYRYYTRSDNSDAYWDCNAGSLPGAVDPLNIIGYRYGEGLRMHDHLRVETDYGDTSIGSNQVTCVTVDGEGYWTNLMFGDQSNNTFWYRGHFRSFTAGHSHDDIEFKWSVFDVHHEGCCEHDPNADWEDMETDLGTQMSGPHNIYWDEYVRVANGFWRGWWDNGAVTRIGGLHYGGY